MTNLLFRFSFMMMLMAGLTACFSASIHFQFDEQGQVTIENGVILEKNLLP